jgi:hypothetical protein
MNIQEVENVKIENVKIEEVKKSRGRPKKGIEILSGELLEVVKKRGRPPSIYGLEDKKKHLLNYGRIYYEAHKNIDPLFHCEICNVDVSKYNVLKHKRSFGHKKNIDDTLIKPISAKKISFCELCNRQVPKYRFIKHTTSDPIHLKNEIILQGFNERFVIIKDLHEKYKNEGINDDESDKFIELMESLKFDCESQNLKLSHNLTNYY